MKNDQYIGFYIFVRFYFLYNSSCQLWIEFIESKGKDEQDEFEQKAFEGNGMNGSEKQGFDFTESGFDSLSHLFFNKSYPRRFLSLCMAPSGNHQCYSFGFSHIIFNSISVQAASPYIRLSGATARGSFFACTSLSQPGTKQNST